MLGRGRRLDDPKKQTAAPRSSPTSMIVTYSTPAPCEILRGATPTPKVSFSSVAKNLAWLARG